MSSALHFDVLTVGAGLVGASFALALRDSGLRCAVVESAAPRAPTQNWDARIYAISPASVAFLRELGVWQQLDAARIQSVERMEIHGDRPDATLHFSAYEAGAEALAYIVESGRLQYALWRALEQSDVGLMSPARGGALDLVAHTLNLVDGQSLESDLIVGADGANSWLRQAAGIATQAHAYGQRGVVANFDCADPHQGVAYQWFRSDGVLALLPLPGRRVSMVWSTDDAHAQSLLEMDDVALGLAVERACGSRLGGLKPFTAAQAFPLQLMRADSNVLEGLALIGDAAHVVHPLAGQGVNLGFGDAQALARVIRAREPGRRCGELALLRRYARARAEPIAAMRGVTHGLERLFSNPGRLPTLIRNAGLNLSDRLPVLKTWLIRHALG